MQLRKSYLIVTFLPLGPNYITPQSFIEKVNETIPLGYGNYDQVAYYSDGTEQFRPLPGSNPTFGKQGETASLRSTRIEFSLPYDAALLQKCLALMQTLHPWEEPVIQIHTLDETIAAVP